MILDLVLITFVLGLAAGAALENAFHHHRRRKHKPRPARLIFLTAGVEIRQMQLKVNDSLPLSLAEADKFGNPISVQAPFDSAPVWSSSDETVAVVTPAADGLSASVTSPTGKIGSAVVQVSGLVAGATFLGSLALDMVAGDVAEIMIQPGAPVAV